MHFAPFLINTCLSYVHFPERILTTAFPSGYDKGKITIHTKDRSPYAVIGYLAHI